MSKSSTEVKRTCKKCSEKKLLTEFTTTKTKGKLYYTYRCKACSYLYRRKWYRKNLKKMRKYYREYEKDPKYYKQWCENNPDYQNNYHKNRKKIDSEFRKQANCRAKTHYFVKKGKLKKQPCTKCGEEKAQVHHKNYNDPLDIIWLCKPCHLALHTKKRNK